MRFALATELAKSVTDIIILGRGENIIDKSVMEVNIRKRFDVNIIAVENGKTIVENVGPDYVFKKGDILFVSGSRNSLNHLSEWK